MEIKLICIGKTDSKNIKEIVETYLKRINRYVKFSLEIIYGLRFNFNEKKQSIEGGKRIFFFIGGSFAYSEEIYKELEELISLSKMAFSHQIIRLLFCVQL
jgi:23S rRNA (pseudouridine1915-N3)-methyltransferase